MALNPSPANVVVSSGADLARALKAAQPGQRIHLSDGVYKAPGKRFEVTAPGVIIESQNPLGARLSSSLKLGGSDQTAKGLLLDGVSIEIAGDRSRLTASKLIGTDGIAVQVTRGIDTRVDYNELSGIKGRGISIDPDPANPSALQRPRVDHNYLHDWIGKPGTNVHEGIQIGQTLTHTDIPVRAVVEYNLIERVGVDAEAISIKSSENVVRFNTLLDSEAAIKNRHGERNVIAANWVEGARGIRVLDEGNQIIGNSIKKGGSLSVMAGDVDVDSKSKGFPRAADTVLAGNDVAQLTIGAPEGKSTLPALRTRIEGPQGAEPRLALAAETVVVPSTSIDVPVAFRLATSEVGPGAQSGEPSDPDPIDPDPIDPDPIDPDPIDPDPIDPDPIFTDSIARLVHAIAAFQETSSLDVTVRVIDRAEIELALASSQHDARADNLA